MNPIGRILVAITCVICLAIVCHGGDEFGLATSEDIVNCRIGLDLSAPIPSSIKTFSTIPELISEDIDKDATCGESIVVVVDVMNVSLIALGGFDFIYRFDNASTIDYPYAYYRIEIRIRKVLKGKCAESYLSFPARCSKRMFMTPGGWLFYKGITLKIGMEKSKEGGFFVRNILPVLPYPPYSTGDVKMSGARPKCRNGERCLCEMTPLSISYGDHTIVEFDCKKKIGCNEFGFFYDFGLTSTVRVTLRGDESNREYWEDAWFAPEVFEIVEEQEPWNVKKH